MRVLIQVVCDPEPVEFITELMIPFTFSKVLNSDEDPYWTVTQFESKYWVESTNSFTEFCTYFEHVFASTKYADEM